MGSTIVNSTSYRDKALRSLAGLPPFSPILNKLMATLASDDVSFGELAELIEKDAVLAGNALRMVNSALYGRRGTISSVRHAVSLMGLVKLRNAVMTLSVSQMWNQVRMPKGWSSVRFNQHSVATAVMADLIAQKVDATYPEGAFVAGLLHDIGLLLIAISFPQEFAEIRDLQTRERQPTHECEREILGFDHSEISSAALNKWNLPEPIQKAVQYQFELEERVSEKFPLSWVLHCAEHAAAELDITVFREPTVPSGEAPQGALDLVGLGSQWEQICSEFEVEFEPIKAFF